MKNQRQTIIIQIKSKKGKEDAPLGRGTQVVRFM
jgi:hypothetical protein